MALRVRIFVSITVLAAILAFRWASDFPSHQWLRFSVYLVAAILSSGLKVAMPKRDGTMSVNFPFILLGVVELSPIQAIAVAALSVAVQCRIRIFKPLTFLQVAFNLANVIVATTMACLSMVLTTHVHMAIVPALTIASVTYFFVNTLPVAWVIGWSSEQAPATLWRREFLWYLPFYFVGAFLAAVAHLVGLHYGQMTSLMLIPVIYTIYRAYQSQMKAIQDRQRHLDETEALHFRTIEGLAMAIEAKDQNTHDHLIRVRLYVSEIGKSFGLPELEMKALITAAFLHDIGKLAVPEYILNKPGKLTLAEFETIKTHPGVGAHILERVRFPYPVVPIVRSHHEAWDGSGYPDGLKGEEIPLGARILTVVDCFDALASDRPYRKAMPIEKAMALVKQSAGTQFDPRVVEVLERCYIELEESARKQGEAMERLDTGGSVWRGAAPAAGFQRDSPNATGGTKRPQSSTQTTSDPMRMIAAASLEAQAIFEMSNYPGNPLRLDETLAVMSSRLKRLMRFDCFALYLLEDHLLTLQYMDGEGASCFSASISIPFGEGPSGWAAQSGKTIVNGSPQVEPNYSAERHPLRSMAAALALPLLNLNGSVFGVLTLYSETPDGFSTNDLRTLQAVELKLSLTLRKALVLETSENNSRIDRTTQLPNVRQFLHLLEAEINKASRLDQKFCVVVCDLNSFKTVNNQQGQLTGDLLLRSIASALIRCCRSYDIVACMGGDEFLFLLPGMDATTCSQKIEAIQTTIQLTCRELTIDISLSASTGAVFFPEEQGTAEELLSLAERRMYLQKSHHYQSAKTPHAALPTVEKVA